MEAKSKTLQKFKILKQLVEIEIKLKNKKSTN